ncbi:MAG: hypothetical protein APF76_15510 [Desulfitibacter sp. BRH_c19]|nr:MAG: hypothetical protein APF76_15510 [Desulfitibacter sp. BRH_c19]
MKSFQITVLPTNRKIEVTEEKSLHSALTQAGIDIEGTCGGKGTCGKCKVRVLEGKKALAKDAGKKLSKEEKEAGWRLACLIPIEEDMTISIPAKAEEGDRKTHLSGKDHYQVDTQFKKTNITMPKPSLEDQKSDINRIIAELGEDDYEITLQVLEKAPKMIRDSKFNVTVTSYGKKIIDIEKGDTTKEIYGVAFDIGTTTVVGTLINLVTGEVTAANAAANAQRSYGADVIARITYVSENKNGLEVLKNKVVETMNNIINSLIDTAKINPENIYSIVTVGNTVMQHLLIGSNPINIAMAPYTPVFQNSLKLNAYTMGIHVNKEAVLYTTPNVAGYVGADTVGVILATHIEESEDILLAVDIGTNGEIMLGNKDRIIACSAAAGPAFEGAQIKKGMRAADGAIEKVTITDDVYIDVIGNKKPIGICGSGLVDAVAELIKVGIINLGGRLLPSDEVPNLTKALKDRIVEGRNGYDFVIYKGEDSLEDVVLTQKDVRELQLAKGAIYAGIKILISELGIEVKDINRVLLAGAFGNYIQVESAKTIALLPEELEVEQVGNAAGIGARMVLASDSEKARADYISDKIKYIELSSRKDFQDVFMTALGFGN